MSLYLGPQLYSKRNIKVIKGNIKVLNYFDCDENVKPKEVVYRKDIVAVSFFENCAIPYS